MGDDVENELGLICETDAENGSVLVVDVLYLKPSQYSLLIPDCFQRDLGKTCKM